MGTIDEAGLAQRYGVDANLLFTWRRWDARSAVSGGVEAVELLPVRVEDERPPAVPEPIGRMEIVLAAGERILVGVDVDAAALARVVKALSRR
jgi:transposase